MIFHPTWLIARGQILPRLLVVVIAWAWLVQNTALAAPPAAEKFPIPKTALAVAQWHGLEQGRERLLAMLQTAMPDLAPRAKAAMTQAIAKLLDGRDLSALRNDGRILAILTNIEDISSDTPPIILYLPVRSYREFRTKMLTKEEQGSFRQANGKIDRYEAHGITHYAIDFSNEGGYLAITEHEDSALLIAGEFERLDLGNPADPVASAFLRADASLYVHIAAINDRYGDQIRNIRQILNFALQQAANAQMGIDERQQEQARLLFDGLFQAMHDGTAMSVGLRFLPNGLQTQMQIGFSPKSVLASLLADQQPVDRSKLADLPQGQLMYSASRISPAISRWLAALGPEYRAADGDSEAERSIQAYTEQMESAIARGMIQATHGADRQIRILMPSDSAKLVDSQLALYKHLSIGSEYANVKLKTKPTVKRAIQKAAGFTLHEARLHLDFAAMVEGISDENLRDTTIASMKRFVPEKPILWFGTDGKQVVQILAPDWETANALLTKAIEKSHRAGALSGFQKTIAQLPPNANLIVLNDIGGTLEYLNDLIVGLLDTVPGLPIREIPKLGAVPKEPAFLGTAITAAPGTLGLTLSIPSEAMKTGRAVLQPVFEGLAAPE